MTDEMNPQTPHEPRDDEADGESTYGSSATGAGATGREWLSQLQSMIENVTTQAGPVVRDIAAKAAELAAIAGEKAGPVATRAAEMTADAGQRIAERSRDFAADLRRDRPAEKSATPTDDATPGEPPTPLS
ncbi:MAG: hypothetical protein HYX57_05610 [Chloroflexi bacterium]|nr:hypothetical protein [Chloroflexota bacterium]